MDTVYGTKKYYHNVLDNECNRSVSNRAAATTTNGSPYQNGLCGGVGIGVGLSNFHSHTMNKFMDYSDMQPGIPSQYSYYSNSNSNNHNSNNYNTNNNNHNINNGRNMWKDTRNLTPSSFTTSSKSKTGFKSFTVLLITAAFIVILAVLSIAALAYYFSNHRPIPKDSIMVFDGKMEIARGDVYTTGLRYNHTTVYQQKTEFYEHFIAKALRNNELDVSKSEILGFGMGPGLMVLFRIYLDMRFVPINVKNIEQHIKESLLRDSGFDEQKQFRNIKIDRQSIVVKRLLDNELIQSASFIVEQTTLPPSIIDEYFSTKLPTKQLPIQNKVFNRTNASNEAKLDVIKGSFQVTKTDADITQRKTIVGTSTIRPFSSSNSNVNTNGNIKMKTKKITIEKVKPLSAAAATTTTTMVDTTKMKSMIESITNIDIEHVKGATTIVPKQKLQTTTTRQTTIFQPTTKIAFTSSSPRTTTTTSTTTTKRTTRTTPTTPPIQTTTPTTLATNLIYQNSDNWRPIHPIMNNSLWTMPKLNRTMIEANEQMPHSTQSNHIIEKNKTILNSELQSILYQNFGSYKMDTNRYEQLGNGYIKPYPLPVNKITDDHDEDNLNSTTTTTSATTTVSNSISSSSYEYEYGEDGENIDENKFEQIPTEMNERNVSTDNQIGFMLLNMLNNSNALNLNHDKQTNIESVPGIEQKSNHKSDSPEILAEDQIFAEPTLLPTLSNPAQMNSTSIELSLFQMNSKFSNNNGNKTDHLTDPIRRVFNETLHAWIVESIPKPIEPATQLIDIKKTNLNHIKNISSIFDTLSSKLGVYPAISTKLPPFGHYGPTKMDTTTTQFNLQQLNKRLQDHLISKTTTATTFLSTPSTPLLSFISTSSSSLPPPALSITESTPIKEPLPIKSAPIVGEAEIVEIDPVQYEDILLSQKTINLKTSTLPTLVTLLPVKSNSGIRPILNKGILSESFK